MFKKVKPAALMIVLIILLAIYFIVRYSGSDDRNFRDRIVEFDPSAVTELVVSLPGQLEKTQLRKEGNDWKVIVRGQAYRADTTAVKNVLDQLSQLVTKRFAGRGKDIWEKFELTDSAAVRVLLKSGKKEVADLMIGKFDYRMPPNQQSGGFRQQQGEMSTYVRQAEEKDVYVVDGFLKMSIGKPGDTFRDKTLTGINRQDIGRMMFEYPDEKMELQGQDGRWTMNGIAADSMKMVKYLNLVSRLTSQDFLYDNIPLGSPSHTLTLEGNNFSPIEINAYPVADTNIQYVLVSNRNPEAFFNGKKSGLFSRLMVGQDAFLPDPAE